MAATMPADVTVPDVEPAPPPSRAGRNLPIAILMGLALGALVIVPLYSPYRWTFVVVMVAAMALGTYEIVKALRTLGAQPPLMPLLVGGTAMVVLAYREGAEALFVALVLTVLACLVWRLADPAEGYLRDLAAAVFTAAYVPFLGGFVALLLAEKHGALAIVTFILVTIASDIGGYAVGVLAGKHPMAPVISPKKSWEGFAGSALSCVLVGWLTVAYLLDGPWWAGVVLGLVSVVMATMGDLCESVIKRDLGIKDMSQIVPGHGGLMDRLDSLLATAAPAWLLLHYLVF